MAICSCLSTDSASGLLAALVKEWPGPISCSAADAGCEGRGKEKCGQEPPKPVPTVQPDTHGHGAESNWSHSDGGCRGDVQPCARHFHNVLLPTPALHYKVTHVWRACRSVTLLCFLKKKSDSTLFTGWGGAGGAGRWPRC